MRARAADWLASYESGIVWEDRDREITADDTVAFCSMLSHVSGALKTGTRVDMWFRKTLGFQHRGDRWLITHDGGISADTPPRLCRVWVGTPTMGRPEWCGRDMYGCC